VINLLCSLLRRTCYFTLSGLRKPRFRVGRGITLIPAWRGLRRQDAVSVYFSRWLYKSSYLTTQFILRPLEFSHDFIRRIRSSLRQNLHQGIALEGNRMLARPRQGRTAIFCSSDRICYFIATIHCFAF